MNNILGFSNGILMKMKGIAGITMVLLFGLALIYTI